MSTDTWVRDVTRTVKVPFQGLLRLEGGHLIEPRTVTERVTPDGYFVNIEGRIIRRDGTPGLREAGQSYSDPPYGRGIADIPPLILSLLAGRERLEQVLQP